MDGLEAKGTKGRQEAQAMSKERLWVNKLCKGEAVVCWKLNLVETGAEMEERVLNLGSLSEQLLGFQNYYEMKGATVWS